MQTGQEAYFTVEGIPQLKNKIDYLCGGEVKEQTAQEIKQEMEAEMIEIVKEAEA